MFEALYRNELQLLQGLQYVGDGWQGFWMQCTKLGDPAWTLKIYFPLLFALWPQRSAKFLIAGCLSEFVNGVLKWCLHGDRPYWYVPEHGITDITLHQTPLTCETGPGNPSGHVMVTAAVFYVITRGLGNEITRTSNRAKPKLYKPASKTSLVQTLVCAVKSSMSIFLWILFGTSKRVIMITLYSVLLLLVAVSRLYIVAHFPHQVLLGLAMGVLIGKLCCNINIPALTSRRFRLLQLGIALGSLGVAVHYALSWGLHWDLNWSIEHAWNHCASSSWIHISTTPLASMVRNLATIFGLYLAMTWKFKITKNLLKNRSMLTIKGVLLSTVISVLLTLALFDSLHHHAPHLELHHFYGATIITAICSVFGTVTVAPKLTEMLLGFEDVKNARFSE